MTVMIDNRQNINDTGGVQELIEQTINKALECEEIKIGCQVSVTFVDNEQIREINREYRNIDAPTDVLSFPMLDNKADLDRQDITNLDMDTGDAVLGDIVLSLQKALEQSQEYGHSYEREIAFLTVHGVLHLLGYDHETETDRIRMREREEHILEQLNLKR